MGHPFEQAKEATIVYLGGSITQGAGASDGKHSWVGLVSKQLDEHFPTAKLRHVNAGLGGTTSQMGLLRLKKQVLDCDPDVVLVEFAVNDCDYRDDALTLRYMESIVRTLMAQKKVPYIIFVYTTDNVLQTPSTVQHRLAEAYGIPEIDLRAALIADPMYAKDAKPLFADDVHPADAGHAYYAGIIGKAMEDAAHFRKPTAPAAPLSPDSRIFYGKFAEFCTDETLTKTGRWFAAASANAGAAPAETCSWLKNLLLVVDEPEGFVMGTVCGKVFIPPEGMAKIGKELLVSSDAGASVQGTFHGNVFGLVEYIGFMCGIRTLAIDGVVVNEKSNYYNPCIFQPALTYATFDLPDGEHTFTITVTGEKCAESLGTQTVLMRYITEE